MYLIVETVHQECEGDKAEWRTMRQTFRAELGRTLGSFWELNLGGFLGVLGAVYVLPMVHQTSLCHLCPRIPAVQQ